MKFGEKLQKLRRGAGMSQEELAGRLEVSRQAVSRWELDGTLPDAGRVAELSRIFSVSADYLLKDELETPEPPAFPQEFPERPAAKRTAGRGMLIAAAITGGLGALGMLVIAVLSSMIAVYGTIVIRNGGNVRYTSGWTYSFTQFVEKYRLWALVGIFGVLIAVGLLLFWSWFDKRRGKKPPAAGADGNLSGR